MHEFSLADFSHLTPDHVIAQVEDTLDLRCTNLCRQLNSYINRVYEVQAEDGAWYIIKFYRPGRWSRAALLDELTFLRELAEAEIPVVAPLIDHDHGLLEDERGICYTIFPKLGGRPLVEPSRERWVELGRLLARVHRVGETKPPNDRIRLHPEYATVDHVEAILDTPFPYESLWEDYANAADELINLIAPAFERVDFVRIHADCHAQNLLDRPDEPLHLIDFDDMASGPVMQDIWMLLPDRPGNCRAELDLIISGYETFRAFPYHEIKIVEALRAMRFIHYTAWCARQNADGGFNRLAPDWGSAAYWKKEIDDLRKQIAEIEQAL